MDAIDLLTGQHRDVEDLFDELEEAEGEAREDVFERIADALAVHATIEEKIFYPATVKARTRELLSEAVEEHLAVKRLVADLMRLDAEDPRFDAKCRVLQEQVQHHVEEEEQKLFPEAQKLLGSPRLAELGDELQRMADELVEEGAPRQAIPSETEEAAPI